MAILTQDEARTLLQKVLAFSKADECKVQITGRANGNIRYARNAVSTSGQLNSMELVIYSSFGKKQGITTINEYDDASLAKAVKRSEDLARLAPENPEYMPLPGPQAYPPAAKTFIQSTADITSKQRADLTESSIRVAKDANVSAAGYIENNAFFNASLNSHGLFNYSTGTNIDFSVTLRTEDGTGSGYAAYNYNDVSQLDVQKATQTAAWKATKSIKARAIEPGKYTVILEPAAGIVLMENLWGNLDARSADEGRSFLSLPGGKTRLGEKLVDEQVNIYSDPSNELLPTRNYDGEGLPQTKRSWIEKGVVKNLFYSRYWAAQKKVDPIPYPYSFIMTGGTASVEDLIKSTEKGILVTRLWYIRSVDPQTLLYTGLTRDGTFYIENGEIKFPVKNFRFNESPIIMLNNLEALGRPERTISGESFSAAVLPPMKIRDFTFTSLSDAV
ncbi:MAG: TldD/PmbA family protein [Bacteroidetes bacterium]|nr:TldD/PmbA family protein [Bacteroidota bacterium]